MNKSRIYFLCPDDCAPMGGIKQIYRHIDVLNKNGFSAFVLHTKKGFRYPWFKNNTKIAYNSNLLKGQKFTKKLSAKQCALNFILNIFYYLIGKYKNVKIKKTDYLVAPEVYGPHIADIEKGVKKVILNQNPFYMFDGYSFNKNELKTPYLDKDVVATIVCSEYNLNYMKYLFPELNLFRIHYGFDPEIFKYTSQKKKQIAFMSRKDYRDVLHIINTLKFRGIVKDFELVEIEMMKEKDVARILKESLIFFSFSSREGFGMPVAEAMACGCIVIGYHGMGGKELFKEEFCYPIGYGDLINFVDTVEMVIQQYGTNRDYLLQKGKKASEFILKTYSLEVEEKDIVSVWKQIVNMTERQP